VVRWRDYRRSRVDDGTFLYKPQWIAGATTAELQTAIRYLRGFRNQHSDFVTAVGRMEKRLVELNGGGASAAAPPEHAQTSSSLAKLATRPSAPTPGT
jgi:hypothetical protein